MYRRPSLRDSLHFGFKRFTGTPVETDLKPYAEVVAEARLADIGGLGGGILLERARAPRAGIEAPALPALRGAVFMPMPLDAEPARRRCRSTPMPPT